VPRDAATKVLVRSVSTVASPTTAVSAPPLLLITRRWSVLSQRIKSSVEVGVHPVLAASLQSKPPVAEAPAATGEVPVLMDGALIGSVATTFVPLSETEESMIEFAPFAFGRRFVVNVVDVVLPLPAGTVQDGTPLEVSCSHDGLVPLFPARSAHEVQVPEKVAQ